MNELKANMVSIRTPEGVVFRMALAGPAVRCAALMVDLGCALAACSIIAMPLRVLNVVAADIAQAVNVLLYFVVLVGYGVFLEWRWSGQTIGKRLFALRVMDEDGLRLSLAQALVRNLLRMVDMLPAFYLVGGVVCVLTRRFQRLGDLAAGTIVVRELPTAEPDLDMILPDKFNAFREHPRAMARARERIAGAEASVIHDALIRRNSLTPEARGAVYARLVEHFRGTLDFPPEATDGLSDERFLRNLADILFRR